jgi:hypothetical protein
MGSLDFVCLASSWKHNGRCVAGITRSGEWIRPVSPEPDGTLYSQHYILNDGSEPATLDVIRIDAFRAPEPHQPENWRISGTQWQHVGRLRRQEAKPWLQRAANPGPYLLGSSSDRISYEYLVEHPIQSSLCLVDPLNFCGGSLLTREATGRFVLSSAWPVPSIIFPSAILSGRTASAPWELELTTMPTPEPRPASPFS